MAGRRLDALTLTEAEEAELTAIALRPKTAQALAQRARIALTCADGLENKAVACLLDVHAMTVGNGVAAFWHSALTACATTHGRASLSEAAMTTSGMLRRRCSPRSTWPLAKSSASAIRNIAPQNSASSSTRSRLRHRQAWMCICLGQLRHAQNRADPRLVGQAPALASPPGPDQQFVAESGGTLLRTARRKADQARGASQRRRTRSRHQCLS